jgi:hypothetical protein
MHCVGNIWLCILNNYVRKKTNSHTCWVQRDTQRVGTHLEVQIFFFRLGLNAKDFSCLERLLCNDQNTPFALCVWSLKMK